MIARGVRSGSAHPAPHRDPDQPLAGWWRRADESGHGLHLDLGLYLLSAAFAGVTAATSTLPPHRAWGTIAVWGYAAGAVLTLALRLRSPADAITRGRAGITALSWAAVAWLPMIIQAVERAGGRTDRAQEEVIVVEHAGQRLLDTGTPYLERAAIAALPEPERLLGYTPYQPGMAVFGLPRAVFGTYWWTDARIWFAIITAAALAAAVYVLRSGDAGLPGRAGPRDHASADRGSHERASSHAVVIRAVQAATVLPLCALTLATGGDDLPVLALCLLALAITARDQLATAQPAPARPAARDQLARTGLVAGAAGALKLFAWPVALVLAAHAATRRRLLVYLAGAIGLPLLALLPALLVDAGAAIENVVAFPLGRGLVTSPAQSPFPGHLIATGVPGGRVIAAGLLVAAGVAIAAGLLRRPPRTAASAALWAGYGLLVAILLMPSTRFGYLLYPVALLVWAPALRRTPATGS
jgi:hypothetical protein